MRCRLNFASLPVLGLLLLLPASSHAQGYGKGSGFKMKPEDMFKWASKGKDYIVIADSRDKDALTKFASEHNITDGKITLPQYVQYREWKDKQGDTGGGPKKMRGGNDPNAKGPTFGGPKTKTDQAAAPKPAEKKAEPSGPNPFGFFAALAGKNEPLPGATSVGSVAKVEPPKDETPVVIRAGKLPKGLPEWFEKLDTDHDGQVSLAEWLAGGKDLSEFKAMDLNNDGLLTAEEVLQFVASKK